MAAYSEVIPLGLQIAFVTWKLEIHFEKIVWHT